MISEFMTDHHRECDELIIEAENLVNKSEWDKAKEAYKTAYDNFILHFDREENVMFPAFESRTGMQGGPTHVMRMEHEQMKKLLESMQESLNNEDKEKFLGFSESFMILVQQHNMKEEQMLYAMTDRVFAEDSNLLLQEIKEV